MVFGATENTLLLSSSASEQERLSCQVEVVERGRVLFAGEVSALKVEEFVDEHVNDVFNAATVDAHIGRVAVLESYFDVFGTDDRFTAVDMTELFHVFAHVSDLLAFGAMY